jgi:type IV pilus assembly protein PilC
VAVFEYQALDQDRLTVRGTIAADSPRQARELLRGRGLSARSVTAYADRGAAPWKSRLFASHHSHAWAMSVHELALLLRAGTPLLDAIDILANQHRGGFRAALIQVRDRVASGASLTDALRQRPEIFDPLSIQMVEVGENAGNLDEVLRQLAEFKQRMGQLKDQVFTALLYPGFVLCFGILATIFLMTYVMPPLLDNLDESLVALPWPTRVVKFCSDLLLDHKLVLGVGTLAGIAGLVAFGRSTRGHRVCHRLVLQIPLIGPMATRQAVARIAMIISTLIRSGVALTSAIQLAARSTNNIVLQEALDDCSHAVAAGQDVASSLQKAGVFPSLVIQIFSVGQESGELEEMLNQLSSDYNRQVTAMSARLAALLEPILIILLAGFIGFVLLATILPILEAGNVL